MQDKISIPYRTRYFGPHMPRSRSHRKQRDEEEPSGYLLGRLGGGKKFFRPVNKVVLAASCACGLAKGKVCIGYGEHSIYEWLDLPLLEVRRSQDDDG